MKKAKLVFVITVMLFSLSKAYADSTQDLAKAVKEHNIAGMKAAIAAGADVNAKDAGGHTPLNCAIWWTDEVTLLIDAKADVNLNNPLVSAASWGETESVNLLLKAGAKVNAKDGLGQTALISAAFGGSRVSTLQALIDAGAEIDAKENSGQTALFTLATNGYTPKERVTTITSQSPYLVKAGLVLPPRLLNPKESDYSSVGEMIDVLVKAKADVNYSIGKGFTILNYAAKMGRNDAIAALIKAGADVNVKTVNGWTALCYAADKKSCTQGALALIAAGADVNYVLPVAGFNQENGAASISNEVDAGSEKLVKSHAKKVTALMLAAKEGNLELVNALISAKADLDAVYEASAATNWSVVIGVGTTTTTTSERGTAMTLANDFKHPEVASILEKAGAKPVREAIKNSKKK